MTYFILFFSLIIIGVLSHISGKIAEFIKLPSLIGMMICGMFIGPYFLNFVPTVAINSSFIIKDWALVTVLFIAGLGISSSQMKKIGRPAILLSIIPATIEGFVIAYLSTIFLGFDFIQGAILGFIIAAVSPAVLIPSMLELIDRRLGEDKSIPQMLLVGASADDTVAITLFTTFLSVYMQKVNGESFSIIHSIIIIPLSIIFSIFLAYILCKISTFIFSKFENKNIKVMFSFFICIFLRIFESSLHLELFNSLLTVMLYGFFLRSNIEDTALNIKKEMDKCWKLGKLYLFIFVGMAINPILALGYFKIGLLILTISLSFRSIGVLIALIGTNLTFKERLFCIIAYLPKATVQSAKAGIPLQMGVAGGEIMQAISLLSVLITAPIGAIGIKLTAPKFLNDSTNSNLKEITR